MTCPQCGASTTRQDAFCPSCGTKVGATVDELPGMFAHFLHNSWVLVQDQYGVLPGL